MLSLDSAINTGPLHKPCYLLRVTVTIKLMLQAKLRQDVFVERIIFVLERVVVVEVRDFSALNEHIADYRFTSTQQAGYLTQTKVLRHLDESKRSRLVFH